LSPSFRQTSSASRYGKKAQILPSRPSKFERWSLAQLGHSVASVYSTHHHNDIQQTSR
jgi:hypothetical protein